jgi:flagellar FliL protein
MAKKSDDKPAKGGKGKAIAIYLVVLAIGAVVGAKVLGGGGASAAPSTAGEATTTTVAGPVVPLPALTVNLADGRLLKVGMALQLGADAEHGGGGGGHGGGGAAEDDPTKGYAPAMDTAIEVFGEQRYDDLLGPGGRDAARILLEEHLKEHYHDEIVGVYFYEFVMQ